MTKVKEKEAAHGRKKIVGLLPCTACLEADLEMSKTNLDLKACALGN